MLCTVFTRDVTKGRREREGAMSLRFNNKNVQENVKVNTADQYYMCITDGIGGIWQEMD